LAQSEKIAEVVREVIEESGLPRTLIAEDANLSRATLITWLAGTRTPQPETVWQLADGLEKRATRLQVLVLRLRSVLQDFFPSDQVGQSIVAQLGTSGEVLLEFVAVYARLEYALKQAGRVDDGGQLRVRWQEFIAETAPYFRPDANTALREAVRYIAEHPPKKQVLVDGRVAWREVQPGTLDIPLQTLVEHVRRIRNNLFHGGKFASNLIAEPARNERLLYSGVLVLNEVVRLSREHDPEVYSAFTEQLA
jgi:transcriptional regulator with XRE-family HTH domain